MAAGPDILASRQGAASGDGDAAAAGSPPDRDVSRPVARTPGQVLSQLFDENPAAATDRFLHLAADKTAAATLLKSLSDAARQDVVLGITDAFGAQFFTGAAKFTVWSLMVLVLLFRPEGLLKED